MRTIKIEIILLIAVVFMVYNLIFKKPDPEEKKQQELEKELNETKLTFPKSQYYQFADSLEVAMENATTDEDTIYNIFKKLKSNNDYLMLVKAFGKRVYTGELFGGITSMIDFGDGESLEQWLHHELDADEIKQVNYILHNRGIKYRL